MNTILGNVPLAQEVVDHLAHMRATMVSFELTHGKNVATSVPSRVDTMRCQTED